MAKTPRIAIRGMIFYVLALLVLGIIIGAVYTRFGSPSNPAERSASETLPQADKPRP
ncbi:MULTISPECIES: hypothetical protein [Rhizobium]|uniref:Histidine kinase n=1 Tax=Rhizobium mesosinicum TaxID=335017 RepID=A0ABS7GN13_9HYPH|nr:MULTISPECIES: hypothetical protein [Rhizobium]MBB3462751.1 uncharacterized membrane-anchored protein YhcB (DUF1043 family) [Rhizobium sp. BK377]MBW9051320.1 hypothetical protein [Rhizobium mesosinicum]